MHDVKAYEQFRKRRQLKNKLIDLAKLELSRYQNAKRDITHMSERIERLEARINSSVKPPTEIRDYKSQPDPESIQNLLNCAADMRSEYGKKIIFAEGICEYVERLIFDVEGLPGQFLYKRYIIGQGVDVIAHDHIYHRSQVYRLLEIGLLQVGKKMRQNATY